MKKITLIFSFLTVIIFLTFWTQPKIRAVGTIKIWDRNKILLYEKAGTVGKKIPVAYDKFPKYLIKAVIASEDESFLTNPGIDLKAILRSLVLNLRQKKIVTGASTITQQLVRSVISPQQNPSRSLLRKVREILIALRLNLTHSKKDILTMYLNQMYFGNLAYGVQAASQTYFDKDVSQLTLAESAFLAGLISSPEKRNPFVNFNEAKKRQNQVLALMVKNHFISQEKATEVSKEKIEIRGKENEIKAPHFVDYILEELKTHQINMESGINIYTTLDYPTFRLSQDIASLWVNKLCQKHHLSNAAIIMIKNESGEILSMLGGIDYFDIKNSGQVNLTTSPRQPGSALKPITYATAFMGKYTPATLIYDVRKVFKTKKGEGFSPNNYDGRFHGLVLAREALAASLNLPAVEMLYRVGINNFLKTARNLGITTLSEVNRYDLAITLGGGEIKLLELANAYASFARGGKYKETYGIFKIESDNGQVLYQHKDKEGVLTLGKNSRQIAYLISDILSDQKARMLGFNEKNPLVLSHQAAVKTGTTTDWHDNWTIGYTPSFTVGVWVGNNDNSPMNEISGVLGAGSIWNQFFEEYLKDKPEDRFVEPEGIVKREICRLSGMLDDNLCPEKITEIFLSGTEPKEKSKLHKKILIDKRNGLLASNLCPKEYLMEKVFVDYPPAVYTWAKENNLETIPIKYSPLCQEGKITGGTTFLEIVYPVQKAVFENAPFLVVNQMIVFEVNVSIDIKKVIWFVDGNFYKEVGSFPFKTSWPPVTGKHKILAKGLTIKDQEVTSQEVNIEVVEFKDKTDD